MSEITNNIMESFGKPEERHNIIKVIGVGGGGGNAVNHMYREGIHDVSFLVCNTDAQALNASPVPTKLQLGSEGLGAGNKPEVGRAAAEESIENVRQMLNDGTRMVFITAGMGGGTGTGAAPVVARVSRELGILTVGIVTIPFSFEGTNKIDKALDGVEEMAKYVDALLVVNNERLKEIYGSLPFIHAFAKADDTLSVAAKSIAEIITVHGIINLDFNDVKTVLENGGVALMSTGYGDGEERVKKAIDSALNSPLLNNNNIFNSKKILLNISFCGQQDGKDDFMMDELNFVHQFTEKFRDYEIKWGVANDPELGSKVKVTLLATGFGMGNVSGMEERVAAKTQQEAEDLAEQQENEERKRNRREEFYGEQKHTGTRPQRPNIYIFDVDVLDNDNVISQVEQTPTCNRTRTQLKNIGVNSNPSEPQEPERQQPQEPVQRHISFA